MTLLAQHPGSWQLFTCWRQTKGVSSTKRVLRYLSILKSLLIFSLAFWGFFNIVQKFPEAYRNHFDMISAHDHQLQGCVCGETVAEAISLGCKFDSLSMAWLPDHCRDDELTAEFETTGKGKSSAFRRARRSMLIVPSRPKWNLDILQRYQPYD
jgi:hypothetical protein